MDGEGHVVEEERSFADQPNPRYVRKPKNSDGVKDPKALKDVLQDAKSKPGYGEGPDGFQRPRTPGDKMR